MNWLDLELQDIAEWERFWSSPEEARGPLQERWFRAVAAGASPDGPAALPILSEDRLKLRKERHEPVLRMLDEVLGATLGAFNARDFTLLLADPQGVVLTRRAGGGFAEHAERLKLQEGAWWDEATRGTNAIGTAIKEKRPVSVLGAAHLARPNHGLVCYAAPIRDAWGETVAVLDATSFADRADPLACVAVLSAVRALEEGLRLAVLDSARGSLVQRLLGRLRDPAVLVTADGRVVLANQGAVASGLQLGPSQSRGEVLRVGAYARDVLEVTPAELEAAARGQLTLPGLEVEAVESGSRNAAYLVVLTAGGRSASARPRRHQDPFEELVGEDPSFMRLRAHARQVAPSSLPVLILGETGTGKELLATAIHKASDRAQGPLVPLNCAALTPSLLQSELFGYAPNAFTGASPKGREGRIASAHRGTLFLDELAEMPKPLQALLLRFLEDGSYYRVGEQTPRKADVRLICATCRDLPAMVEAGEFRADLFYRIRGAALELPPLRARADRALLCHALLERLARQLKRSHVPMLSPAAQDRIDQAPWPGNTRELHMALHHALVLAGDSRVIEPWHLPATLNPSHKALGSTVPPEPSLAEAEAGALRRALEEAAGNISQAARRLGVARSTVYRMMKKHGLGDDG
ncbi:MAG: sigma-54-dependent Fis family transcriptional regulator [Myxococcota bacterium]|nr:sigma-54-dependent Fis family transcriptional regulator [Myxococcota bacterium]